VISYRRFINDLIKQAPFSGLPGLAGRVSTYTPGLSIRIYFLKGFLFASFTVCFTNVIHDRWFRNDGWLV